MLHLHFNSVSSIINNWLGGILKFNQKLNQLTIYSFILSLNLTQSKSFNAVYAFLAISHYIIGVISFHEQVAGTTSQNYYAFTHTIFQIIIVIMVNHIVTSSGLLSLLISMLIKGYTNHHQNIISIAVYKSTIQVSYVII